MSFPTYAKARQHLQAQFPGQRIRVQGAITMYAEHNGTMIPVTSIQSDMADRARTYRQTGSRVEYRTDANAAITN